MGSYTRALRALLLCLRICKLLLKRGSEVSQLGLRWLLLSLLACLLSLNELTGGTLVLALTWCLLLLWLLRLVALELDLLRAAVQLLLLLGCAELLLLKQLG